MPPILAAEDVVKRIAAECAFVDERGAVGIRLEPAVAIVRVRRSISGAATQVSAPAAETTASAMIGNGDFRSYILQTVTH